MCQISKFFRKFEETTHPQKYARKRIVIDFEWVFLCLRTGAAHKIKNVWFFSGGFAIRAISVFRVKFNVEFTRQAVNFSITDHFRILGKGLEL